MTSFVKPNIVVSQCFEFEKCRYNGETVPFNLIDKLKRHVRFMPICPEVAIGLGVPRETIKIVQTKDGQKLIQPASGKDLTGKMENFARHYVGALKDIEGFIFKSRSPSCGAYDAKVYPKIEPSAMIGRGPGFFAREVLLRFPSAAIEDEGRLSNFAIREHFYIRIFTMARFRKIVKAGSMNLLVKFHSANKFLLMAYHQGQLKALGRIVANPEKKPSSQIIGEYQENLLRAFAKISRHTSHINVLMHALGYFKDQISAKEKQYFLKYLERYRKGVIPLSAVVAILHGWIIKYDKKYLADQTYFEPYPEELVEITDSGKGR